MPGPSSNPALTADLGRNLRDRHPELFRRAQPAPPERLGGRVPTSVPTPPRPWPMGRMPMLQRLMAAAFGFAQKPQ